MRDANGDGMLMSGNDLALVLDIMTFYFFW